jgi:hypothetical protein
MELAQKRGDSQDWVKTYEMATLTFFRLQSQFQLALLCDDLESSQKLALEVDEASVRRLELAEAARTHAACARESILPDDGGVNLHD